MGGFTNLLWRSVGVLWACVYLHGAAVVGLITAISIPIETAGSDEESTWVQQLVSQQRSVNDETRHSLVVLLCEFSDFAAALLPPSFRNYA